MKKTLSVLYGTSAYLVFLGVFAYLVLFAMNFAPHSVSGPATIPAGWALVIDISVITAFGLQHSIMARDSFKRWWTQTVPKHVERSTYVWIANAMVALIVLGWQPIAGDIWNVNGAASVAILAVSALGWLMVPVASLMTDHFELFGLRQVFEYATGRAPSRAAFQQRALYKNVRHPMMLGFLVALWFTPHMTLGHLVFAGCMSAYILTGIYFEERELLRKHGAEYRRYQEEVPKLLPTLRTSEAPSPTLAAKSVR